MDKGDKIYVAGHRGLVGSAIVRRLQADGYDNLLLRTSKELDLREQAAVRAFFAEKKPDYVILAAAKVGGILANDTYPADFIYDNLMMEVNIVEAAHRHNTKKLLALGSTCIYPRMAPQPLKEEYLLTGPLEPTNEWYAVAKIAGIKLCQAYRRQYGCSFIAAMPTNLYGPGDNFDLKNSHVLPALIRKFHVAKENGDASVTLWGTGKPLREFLHVDDLADACLFLMENYDDEEIINIGVGEDLSIAELAGIVRDVVGFEGEIVYDASKPDGTPRKLVDVSKITGLGWHAKTGLRDGVAQTYQWFLDNQAELRGVG
ncbi:GDP-L-fucose synthase [Thiogranum longum]|uniref:GDP-L-fucose synthase n=1 Tax=Thiogranum longum TaxID=1537524 RepID=A0A4R1HGB5_9GAMM|nr:GDP-L-fucose synthase [Thiogranum longum]TCK19455.1 GDP-L-fucose synthase [Thiogranum longum]